MLAFLATQLDQFLVAKVLGGKQLAGYQIAGLIAAIPMITLSSPISAILFPTLCRMQSDPAAFKRTVAAGLTAVMVLGVSMLVAAPFAMPLVFHIALKEEWLFAISATVTLFAAQIFRPPLSVLESSWLAMGQARQGLMIQAIRAGAVILCIPWYLTASSLLDIAQVTLAAGMIAVTLCMAMAFRTGAIQRAEFGGRWLSTHALSVGLCLSASLTFAPDLHNAAQQSVGMIFAPLAYLAMTWGMARLTQDPVTLQLVRGIRAPLRSP
jgi:O-antigen/teichoic acid export membrane protein